MKGRRTHINTYAHTQKHKHLYEVSMPRGKQQTYYYNAENLMEVVHSLIHLLATNTDVFVHMFLDQSSVKQDDVF